MNAPLSPFLAQAIVEYFGTWAGDFLMAFSRMADSAVAYAQNRPIVAFAALAVLLLLYWVTRKG